MSRAAEVARALWDRVEGEPCRCLWQALYLVEHLAQVMVVAWLFPIWSVEIDWVYIMERAMGMYSVHTRWSGAKKKKERIITREDNIRHLYYHRRRPSR